LVQQVTGELGLPVRYVSTDEPTLRGMDSISQHLEAARLEATGKAGAVLVLLGCAPVLIAEGLTESLAGRFEPLRPLHWSRAKMRVAFGWKVNQYLSFGGYPSSAPLIRDPTRCSPAGKLEQRGRETDRESVVNWEPDCARFPAVPVGRSQPRNRNPAEAGFPSQATVRF
jgi:hypothetical protein